MHSLKGSIFGRCSPGGVITILPISAASCIWVETVSAASCERPRLLRAPIDAFFEAVQINTDNAVVRRNRLNLLHRIRETCLRVADLTRIEG